MSNSQKDRVRRIGFPLPLLGDRPYRLSVCCSGPGFIVLEKPAGIISDAHPWYLDSPAVIPSLKAQHALKKPELMPYGMTSLHSVFFLESEVSGMILIATNDLEQQRLRNQLGSDGMAFTFQFLVRARDSMPDQCVCELPLASHFTEKRAVVSSKTGKKSKTSFKRLARWGDFEWWEATTAYPRIHQIRVHAYESGLRIVGEHLYGEPVDFVYLSQLKKRFRPKAKELPIYGSLALHLSSISWLNVEGEAVQARANLPDKLEVLIKKIKEALK